MQQQATKRRYGVRVGLLCFVVGLAGGLMVGRQWDDLRWFFSSGGGFGQTSPDGRHVPSIDGRAHQVRITLKSNLEPDEVGIAYLHSADDLYLRGQGNTITWSEDSSWVEASYADIIGGQKCRMWFGASPGADWRLKRIPVARDGITPLEPQENPPR